MLIHGINLKLTTENLQVINKLYEAHNNNLLRLNGRKIPREVIKL